MNCWEGGSDRCTGIVEESVADLNDIMASQINYNNEEINAVAGKK